MVFWSVSFSNAAGIPAFLAGAVLSLCEGCKCLLHCLHVGLIEENWKCSHRWLLILKQDGIASFFPAFHSKYSKFPRSYPSNNNRTLCSWMEGAFLSILTSLFAQGGWGQKLLGMYLLIWLCVRQDKGAAGFLYACLRLDYPLVPLLEGGSGMTWCVNTTNGWNVTLACEAVARKVTGFLCITWPVIPIVKAGTGSAQGLAPLLLLSYSTYGVEPVPA